MREDLGLYKGKRTDNGEWIQGWYVGKTCKTIFSEAQASAQIIDDNLFWHEVMPDTVCQCSGVPDKNGVKIFEGDIVEALEIGGKQIAPIVFRKGCFLVDGNFGIFRIGVGAYKRRLLKVIGNIFDNPELLKGGAGDD